MNTIKHQLLTLSALALLTTVRAQVKEGRVVYERKVNMHRNLTDESIRKMVPEFNTTKMELRFSSGESLYKTIKEDEDIRDKAGEDQQGGVIMKFGGGDDQVYKNYDTEKMTEQKELGPKKYIIEDSLPKLSWKLEEGTKTLKGYTCKKAAAKNLTGKDVIAWYAEDIRSASGPESYGGLPGLILELDINDGEMTYTALDIIAGAGPGAGKGDGDKMVVKAPTDGKKISRKEFKKMMDDQFGPDTGGGGVKIRIIRN